MSNRLRISIILLAALLAVTLLGPGCYPNPQPSGLTPVPTLPPGQTPTPAPLMLTPLGQTPSLFIPQSLGQSAPFAPELQTAVPPATSAAPAPVSPAADQVSAAAGATLYTVGCLCHGNLGQGVSAPALRNSQFVEVAGDQTLYTVIAFGRSNTRMPAWLLGQCGPLTAQQVQSVVGYLHALQGVPSLATATPAPGAGQATASANETARPLATEAPGTAINLSGDAGRGRAAFGPYCSGCHGPEGLQGIPNPGSLDGSVPVLSPIAADIASPDATIFAINIDLRVQPGRIPAGPSPQIVMPAFGARNLLTQQQIADLIAYIIFLNRHCPGRSCG